MFCCKATATVERSGLRPISGPKKHPLMTQEGFGSPMEQFGSSLMYIPGGKRATSVLTHECDSALPTETLIPPLPDETCIKVSEKAQKYLSTASFFVGISFQDVL